MTGSQWRTRFAPSPTGQLHLGHVAHMQCVWGLARAVGAQVWLRMEDHDRGRCRPEYEQGILTDMAWLGFVSDGGYTGAKPDPWRQSDQPQRYTIALDYLQQQGLLYACDCSRAAIQARMGAAQAGEELRYDGHCRRRGLPLQAGYGIRVLLPDTTVLFKDLWLGPQTQHPASQCGDPLLRDRHGHYTYQLCVVVDDAAQGINLVIRGMDILASTGRQLLLGQLLGYARVLRYAHHPLLQDGQGRKLSKSIASKAVASMREAGYLPVDVLEQASAASGYAKWLAAVGAAWAR